MERVQDGKILPQMCKARSIRVKEEARKLPNSDLFKGKESFREPPPEEFLPDIVDFKGSGDSNEENNRNSFSGASHPPEPVDVDLMRPVYVAIGQNKVDPGCLVRSLSMKGPFLDDLAIRAPGVKSSTSVLSPAESVVDEPHNAGASPRTF